MMRQISDYLAMVAEGKLEGPEIDRLLAACWNQFDGSQEGGVQGRKVIGRMEDVYWDPPILSFTVERHGGTVLGSTRAELQHWQVDLEKKTAHLVRFACLAETSS